MVAAKNDFHKAVIDAVATQNSLTIDTTIGMNGLEIVRGDDTAYQSVHIKSNRDRSPSRREIMNVREALDGEFGNWESLVQAEPDSAWEIRLPLNMATAQSP